MFICSQTCHKVIESFFKQNPYKDNERVVHKMNLPFYTSEQNSKYAKFHSLKEFHQHMERWMLQHMKEFSKGELVGLNQLIRSSSDIPGVCHKTMRDLLREIETNQQQKRISRDTFKRMVKKAKVLGILTVQRTFTNTGLQSSNIYIFQPYPHKNSLGGIQL